MIYSKFGDLSLSRLGFGTMRLPVTEPNRQIDLEKAMEMVGYAYEQGVNYYDTAYFYHSGKSESFIGKALSRFKRDSWYLADKFPGNALTVVDGALKLKLSGFGMKDVIYGSPAEIFELQLERCGVDYFDFYLLHNLDESTYDFYTDGEVGVVDYLLDEKKKGRIRHLGFSSHGSAETIEKFLNWRNCFEFAQIQLNYLDWSMQDAGGKYDVLTKFGLPVIVMEPLRGGKLAGLNAGASALQKAVRPDDTPASWAFRFVQSLPNVAVTLSGMTTMEQLRENIEIFSKDGVMSDSEKAVLRQVNDTMADLFPCTACRYCCDTCPQKLDIPLLLATYSEATFEFSWYVNSVLRELSDSEKPMACTGCGTCSPMCPQNIDIPDAMAKFAALIKAKEKQK